MSEYQKHTGFAPASSWSPERIGKAKGRWMVLQGKKARGMVIDTVSGESWLSDQKPDSFYVDRSSSPDQWSLYEKISSLVSTEPTEFKSFPSHAKFLAGERNVALLYKRFEIPKRSGGVREIDAPLNILRAYQKQLLGVLTHTSQRHKACHGFEPGKSIVTHARQHVGKQFVLTMDIEDFFPSITSKRIYGLFKAGPFDAPNDVARYLSNLTTLNGCLPQGAPTSPILANLVCRGLDSRLFTWARYNGWVYSRYADDLAFSTNKADVKPEEILAIEKMVMADGFTINSKKTKLRSFAQRQMVTGLVVNKRLNVPREYLRNLRAILYNVNRFGWLSQTNRKRLSEVSKTDFAILHWRGGAGDSGEPRPADASSVGLRGEAARARKRASEENLLQKNYMWSWKLKQRRTKAEDGESDSDGGAGDLYRKIAGRVDFVRQVRGSSDLLVKDLETLLDQARLRLRKDTGIDIPKRRRRTAVRLHALVERSKGESGEIVFESVAQSVQKELRDAPEVVWESLKQGRGFLGRMYETANDVDLDPAATGEFFALFEDYRSFRGLLHGASVLENGQVKLGPREMFVDEILGTIEQIADRYPLPRHIKQKTIELAASCREWQKDDEKNASEERPAIIHPYNDESFRNAYLDPFKRDTKFSRDYGMLSGRLEEACKGVEREGVEVLFTGKSPTFYSDVIAVVSALRIIISSMVQHTVSTRVLIEFSGVQRGDMRFCKVRIADDGGRVSKTADVPSLFSGELQEAVRSLRGLAYWKLRSAFDDGVYELDVLGSKDKKALADSEVGGVEHIIRIPA